MKLSSSHHLTVPVITSVAVARKPVCRCCDDSWTLNGAGTKPETNETASSASTASNKIRIANFSCITSDPPQTEWMLSVRYGIVDCGLELCRGNSEMLDDITLWLKTIDCEKSDRCRALELRRKLTTFFLVSLFPVKHMPSIYQRAWHHKPRHS